LSPLSHTPKILILRRADEKAVVRSAIVTLVAGNGVRRRAAPTWARWRLNSVPLRGRARPLFILVWRFIYYFQSSVAPQLPKHKALRVRLTKIRRKFVSPISAFTHGLILGKGKY